MKRVLGDRSNGRIGAVVAHDCLHVYFDFKFCKRSIGMHEDVHVSEDFEVVDMVPFVLGKKLVILGCCMLENVADKWGGGVNIKLFDEYKSEHRTVGRGSRRMLSGDAVDVKVDNFDLISIAFLITVTASNTIKQC